MTQSTNSKNAPTFTAYCIVPEDGSEKGRWLEVGVFFAHKDGKGGNLILDRLPVGGFDGRVVLRTSKAQ